MKSDVKIFVGLDSEHRIAYDVCKFSIERNTKISFEIQPINRYTVREYARTADETESTDFSFARFFVPYKSKFVGISVFMDGDFLFLKDINGLLELYDDRYAVMCCKHTYAPTSLTKMNGKIQTVFPRKNWSSLMLFNNAHPKIKTLNPLTINNQSGAFLHQFKYLDDDEIGSIPIQWNWLVGWNNAADGEPNALHYTEGGPWLPNHKDSGYDSSFHTYREEYERDTKREIDKRIDREP
jgi:lipopolysaccharide biosynthesis glycosyltransferase